MQTLHRGGIALCYELAKGGEPPLVLVHGWCCDHTYFAPQIEHFASRGHSVVAVCFPGHGPNDKSHQTRTKHTFSGFAVLICSPPPPLTPVDAGRTFGG